MHSLLCFIIRCTTPEILADFSHGKTLIVLYMTSDISNFHACDLCGNIVFLMLFTQKFEDYIREVNISFVRENSFDPVV